MISSYFSEPTAKPVIFNQPGEHQVIFRASTDQTAEQRFELVVPNVSLQLLVIGRAKQADKLITQTRVIHAAPETSSSTEVRGVVTDQAQLKVSGAITIQSGAKGAEGRFRSDVLLHGQAASAETFPILEVAENDVRAAHGAAVGRVNDEQLFYLQSRGLSRAQAEQLIIDGFFSSMLAEIVDPAIRQQVEKDLK